jgi:transitional endoplasmic reticulum ATPase
MELRDEVRSQFNQCHRLAKKHYDNGEIAKARTNYLKCSQLLEHLAKLSAAAKRPEIIERSKKFKEIAEGLKEGTVKVYTDGIMPNQPPAVKKSEQEKSVEKAKSLVMAEKPGIKFADIAGLETVKENIKEAIVYPFIFPDEYKYFGVKPGGGILLYGPPGCGKTMLAAAAAAECDAAFINLKVSDIKDKYVGESEKNLKEVFNVARSYDRAILFFDEIDSLAGERSGSSDGHEISLVSELLAQMDGMEAKDAMRKYLVLAATNRPWDVDIALRRPGRFDTTVFVPHPDFAARRKILELNIKVMPLDKEVNVDKLARSTEGFSSAEVASVCQVAAKIPLGERIRENKPRRKISAKDFDQAISKQKTGLAAWYAKAAEDLPRIGEAEMFQELLEAAREYSKV